MEHISTILDRVVEHIMGKADTNTSSARSHFSDLIPCRHENNDNTYLHVEYRKIRHVIIDGVEQEGYEVMTIDKVTRACFHCSKELEVIDE